MMETRWLVRVAAAVIGGLLMLAGTARSEEPVRVVLNALVAEAERNARLPPASDKTARPPYRLVGDELTERLVRTMAKAASELPEKERQRALLLALGIGLDDSTVLRNNPLTGKRVQALESEDARKKRLAVLGQPTLRGRRDLCQHFVVSCALTEWLGGAVAETIGLAKEQQDARGTSGFSFIDLQADLAGITLAERMRKGEVTVERLAEKFRVADYLPEATGLREGMTQKQFEADFGGTSDERFKKQVAALRKRIEELPAYRKP